MLHCAVMVDGPRCATMREATGQPGRASHNDLATLTTSPLQQICSHLHLQRVFSAAWTRSIATRARRRS